MNVETLVWIFIALGVGGFVLSWLALVMVEMVMDATRDDERVNSTHKPQRNVG